MLVKETRITIPFVWNLLKFPTFYRNSTQQNHNHLYLRGHISNLHFGLIFILVQISTFSQNFNRTDLLPLADKQPISYQISLQNLLWVMSRYYMVLPSMARHHRRAATSVTTFEALLVMRFASFLCLQSYPIFLVLRSPVAPTMAVSAQYMIYERRPSDPPTIVHTQLTFVCKRFYLQWLSALPTSKLVCQMYFFSIVSQPSTHYFSARCMMWWSFHILLISSERKLHSLASTYTSAFSKVVVRAYATASSNPDLWALETLHWLNFILT